MDPDPVGLARRAMSTVFQPLNQRHRICGVFRRVRDETVEFIYAIHLRILFSITRLNRYNTI